MADIFEVPAGLIMRVLPEQIEVLVSSHSAGNPYEASEKAKLNTGLYCETVMASRKLLQVPNALEDAHWKSNPDVALNMISYLGVPLLWPDNEVFGTICVLDSKTRKFQAKYVDLMWEIKKSIEADFKVIQQQERLVDSNTELRLAIESQRSDAMKLAQTNEELNAALATLKKMQGELLRSEKMAALGALVAGVSHELNTPIGNSLMAASTLQSHAAEFSADLLKGVTRGRMHEFVEAINQGAELLMRSLAHAAELVGSFKQVAVDQSSMKRRTFYLDTTIAEILIALGPSIRKSGLTVERNIPAGITMDSYPGALGQVLSNLIDNALVHAYAGRAQGRIIISAESDGDDQLRLSVRDEGVGISESNLSRVFDPFFTTRLGQGGSGLGLHIAYNLVHTALRGNIAVDSSPDHGACFTLTLPRVAPAGA
ncbi:MAG: GAF domain-containing sensor histidine kinase [Burkholderiales bacterium]|nr:GAF domain-containing sensor histidine kinase [Burkholderiales bacterium]